VDGARREIRRQSGSHAGKHPGRRGASGRIIRAGRSAATKEVKADIVALYFFDKGFLPHGFAGKNS
jgi:hypothetical protein